MAFGLRFFGPRGRDSRTAASAVSGSRDV